MQIFHSCKTISRKCLEKLDLIEDTSLNVRDSWALLGAPGMLDTSKRESELTQVKVGATIHHWNFIARASFNGLETDILTYVSHMA